MAERVGMEALQAVNRRALELQQRDADGPENDHRMNLGVYFFREDRESKGEASDDS